MRGPLKYLALLLLVPVLTCTDMPAEPETVEAYFAGQGPTKPDPGNYIKYVIKCDWRYSYRLDIAGGTAVACRVDDVPKKGYAPASLADYTVFQNWWLIGGENCSTEIPPYPGPILVSHDEVLKWTPPPECGDASEQVTVKLEYVTIM